MKKLLFTLALGLLSFVLCPSSLHGQTIPPPYINYQAVLYDVNGANPNSPLINQSFSTFVNINDELGNLLYREEHYASTDANGLITVKMGDGLYTAGPITNFNLINWGVGKYYLVVDFDINGTISSTAPEQLVTVPYSFYAGNAGNGMTAVADNGNGTLTFTYANGATYTTPTLSGIQGPAGPVGPSGPSGASGIAGQSAYDLWLAQGNTGTVQDFLSTSAYQIWLAQGNTGTAQDFLNTLVGPSGPQGIQGIAGTNGTNGATGPQGPQGLQGIQGVAGVNGVNGTNGRSAYEIAVLNGFVGTETQWLLSLVGATGPQGIPGTNGANGATGPQGQIGLTGPQGPQGIQGPAGSDGATGSQGPIGLTGPQGSQGSQGIQGPAGATGATGPQGPAGNDGATGPQGPIGLTGPQGPQGLLDNGTSTGNTPYWNGSQWVVNGTNFYNNGGSLGVGTVSPDPSSKLEVSSTTQGFLPPRLTTTQRNAIVNPANGLQIFNLTTGCINYWFNTMWYEWCGTPISTASISALNCGSTSITGTLTSGTSASGVSASVPYTGGNGGSYTAQTISSTGVTGLTATLTSGILANGAGSLSFSISGTPATSGTASFALTIGGQSCSFTVSVQSALAAQYPANSVFCASGPTAIVDVTNPTTGKIWMDRNLGASQVATSSTDAAAYGDLYQWGRGNDGHQCRTSATTATLSSSDTPANGNFILSSSDWRSPQNNNLWQGVNGVNNPCPTGYRVPTETELNAERLSWSVNNASGAYGSPLKLTLTGSRDINNGNLIVVGTYGGDWSSTVSGSDSRGLDFDISGAFIFLHNRATVHSVRCIKDASAIPATLGAINCGSTSVTGTLTSGTAASGVSASVPYTGGNGGSYTAQTISSTGVTGLTSTLTSGILGNGSGSLSFAISGTPATSGTASFALTIGGQSCSFTVSVQSALAAQYPTSSVFCASGPTAIVDVTNPTTGKIWMDRNLGASQVATSSTDAASYGDLYQWGRGNDGHQCRTSATTASLSSTDSPGNGNFILSPSPPYDWRSTQNANLWQGVNGANNPCPSGYRIPTETEINAERLSWGQNTSAGAFASPLKLPLAGYRRTVTSGSLNDVGTFGGYWSSSVSGTYSSNLGFLSGDANINSSSRADGFAVRCIKDASAIPATLGALNCGSTSVAGTLTSGTAASGVSASVPYTGGNGGSYAAQTISSTGVTGLTATLTAGTLANGSGSLSFAISGTPATNGTASFALTIGGQSCSFTIAVQSALVLQYPANSVFCASGPTAIVDVTNPTTGRTWMDRNLGASQVATSSTDAAAYGDLYQWGRGNDGHQCRTSATLPALSTTDQPGHAFFILALENPNDWRSPHNTNLWQGVNGVNNPCPSGYRVPTQIELDAERLSWSSNYAAGAITSPVKLPFGGSRNFGSGTFNLVNEAGRYWSSNISGTTSRALYFTSSYIDMDFGCRAYGSSVRCIKN
jgi:hypothetical protein